MKKFLTASLIMISLILTGCGGTDNKTADISSADSHTKNSTSEKVSFTGEYIVDANYVKNKLANIILVDARGDEAADKATIDGAAVMSWQYLASVDEGKSGDEDWGLVLEPKDLAEKLGEKGIAKDKEIVLFASAQEGWGDDGRIAWELIAAGYPNVKMVDGGFAALKDAGLKTQKGATKLDPVDVSINTINNDHRILTTELKKNYDDYKIVDVRTKKEYDGAVLYGETKGGHLPDAINIEYTKLFNSDGTLKNNEDITKILTDAGLNPDDQIVVYCTAGIRSAYMQLVMEMVGYNNVKNYDGSYYTWAATENVEK